MKERRSAMNTAQREHAIEVVARILHAGVSDMDIKACPLMSCRGEHAARAVMAVDAMASAGLLK